MRLSYAALSTIALLITALVVDSQGSHAAPPPQQQQFVITSIQGTIQPFTYTDGGRDVHD
jgi:hypothetical protein